MYFVSIFCEKILAVRSQLQFISIFPWKISSRSLNFLQNTFIWSVSLSACFYVCILFSTKVLSSKFLKITLCREIRSFTASGLIKRSLAILSMRAELNFVKMSSNTIRSFFKFIPSYLTDCITDTLLAYSKTAMDSA